MLKDTEAEQTRSAVVQSDPAKTLFEHLVNTRPERQYEPGQLRTFQRRVHEWRAAYGPDKEVFFSQQHRPGEAMQTDFTWATGLGITIQGEPFPHLLCHPVLLYSNFHEKAFQRRNWNTAPTKAPTTAPRMAEW